MLTIRKEKSLYHVGQPGKNKGKIEKRKVGSTPYLSGGFVISSEPESLAKRPLTAYFVDDETAIHKKDGFLIFVEQ